MNTALVTPQKTPAFFSPKASLRAAHVKRNDLVAAVNEYFSVDHYVTRTDIEADGTKAFKAVFTDSFPGEFYTLSSGMFGDIRESLDQTAVAVALLLNFSKTQRRKIYFPFASSKTAFETAVTEKCRGFPSEIIALFRAFKPYKGGNNPLWASNKVSNTKKHNWLAPLGKIQVGHNVQFTTVMREPGIETMQTIEPAWNPAKNELTIAVGPNADQLDYNFQIVFDIAYCDVDPIIDGKRVVALFDKSLEGANALVSVVQDECVALGLLPETT